MVQPIINPIRPEKTTEMYLDELLERVPDEASARALVEEMMWGDTPRCAYCGSDNCYAVKSEKPLPWRCRVCKKYFSAKTNTVMHKSVLPYRKWVRAIFFMLSDSKGEAAHKIRKYVGVQHKTAWTVFHRIREGMAMDQVRLSGNVQSDEAFFGGSLTNMHSKKKPPRLIDPKTGEETRRRNWKANKVMLQVLINESGWAVAKVLEAGSNKEILQNVLDHVVPGSTLWTDGARAYDPLDCHGYGHSVVIHSKGQYVNDDGAHTNSTESYWSIGKRSYVGTYHYMSPKHMHRYCYEFIFRHNTKQSNDFATIAMVFRGMMGKRLSYRMLVGPKPEAPRDPDDVVAAISDRTYMYWS